MRRAFYGPALKQRSAKPLKISVACVPIDHTMTNPMGTLSTATPRRSLTLIVILLLFVILVGGCGPWFSNNDVPLRGVPIGANVAIQGRVLSEIGQPLDDVTVTAVNLATNLKSSTPVSTDGAYFIRGLRSGEYSVCATKQDFGETCVTPDDPLRSMIPGGVGKGILVDRDRTFNITLKLRDKR